jgi:hypothetical protein
MRTLRFEIGEAFPASDPVARFVTVLAMASNELRRVTGPMLALEDFYDDAEGLRLVAFRQLSALQHEAALFTAEALRRFPDVASFVDELPRGGIRQPTRAPGGGAIRTAPPSLPRSRRDRGS